MTNNSVKPILTDMETTPPIPPSESANRLRNFLIVLVGIILSVVFFLGLQTQTSTVNLSQLAATATPLDVAMNNHQPTLLEFYANWCTSCQAMAKDLGEIKKKYENRLNFVMLNVDNTKWLPEILKYRVDGIPHFVFLNENGLDLGETIGEVPRQIMIENLEALIEGNPLPHANATGQVSALNNPITSPSSPTDPRAHGR